MTARPGASRGAVPGFCRACLACLVLAAATPAGAAEEVLELPGGRELAYTLVDASARLPSAAPTAIRILEHLANGRIDEAAALSNAPKRRREVLESYRAKVGDGTFRDLYARYLEPQNHVMAEVAIGAHRLLVWSLGDAEGQVAGQFFVEVGGRFLMDDVPSATRRDLRLVLEHYRRRAPR